MITINNLTYSYDKRFSALFQLNVTFKNNKSYVLYSSQELETQTLFRILTKQDKDYIGEIFYEDKNLKEISLKNLSVSYITKTPFLLNNKSVIYNIAYPLIIRKEKKSLALNKAKEILQTFGYDSLFNLKIKNLNYKQKIIVTILRAVLRNAEYIFCDDIFIDEEINLILDKILLNKTCLIASKNKDFKLNENFEYLEFNGGSLK